jgi:hypothetical protein
MFGVTADVTAARERAAITPAILEIVGVLNSEDAFVRYTSDRRTLIDHNVI